MPKSLRSLGFGASLCLLALSACDDDPDDTGAGDTELITTVNVVMVGGGSTQTLSFRDVDGPGGNDGVTTGATLAPNTTYTFATSFLDESESPAENKNTEITEEANEHQVFYILQGINGTVETSDVDGNARPLGLVGTLTTGAAGTGSLRVVLRHEPNKTAAGVADGDITNAGGETDIDVTFPVVIQ